MLLRWASAIIVALAPSTSVFAEGDPDRVTLCAALEPTRPERISEQFEGELQGQMAGLMARLASAGASATGSYESVAEDLLNTYPDSHKLFVWQRMIYIACINPESGVDLDRAFQLYVNGPPAEPRAAPEEEEPESFLRWRKPTPLERGVRLVRGETGVLYASGFMEEGDAIVRMSDGEPEDAERLIMIPDAKLGDIAWTPRDGLVFVVLKGDGDARRLLVYARERDGKYRARYRRDVGPSVREARLLPVESGWLIAFNNAGDGELVLLDREFGQLRHRDDTLNIKEVYGLLDMPGERSMLLGRDHGPRQYPPSVALADTDPGVFMELVGLRNWRTARILRERSHGYLLTAARSAALGRVVAAGVVAHESDGYEDENIVVAVLDDDGQLLFDFEIDGEGHDFPCCLIWADDATALLFAWWEGQGAYFRVDARTGRRSPPVLLTSKEDTHLVPRAAVALDGGDYAILTDRGGGDGGWRTTVSRVEARGLAPLTYAASGR